MERRCVRGEARGPGGRWGRWWLPTALVAVAAWAGAACGGAAAGPAEPASAPPPAPAPADAPASASSSGEAAASAPASPASAPSPPAAGSSAPAGGGGVVAWAKDAPEIQEVWFRSASRVGSKCIGPLPEGHLARKGGARVTVETKVRPDGSVESARATGPAAAADVVRCVEEAVATWKFPATPAGATVTLPFVFVGK